MSEAQYIQWFPGHMTKTRRQMEKELSLVDAVAEIVDARIPASSRNPDIPKLLGKKPMLVILNKCDMADQKATEQWIKWFEAQNINAIAVDCRTGNGINKFVPKVKEILKDKIEANISKGMAGKPLRLMVVGIPNVGKSTFINRMAGVNKAKAENRPGVTRGKQWIRLKGDVELLDTPGILAPKFEDQEVAKRLAYTGAIKDEIMDTELLAYSLCEYLAKNYVDLLCSRYKLDSVDGMAGHEILEKIGRKRGFVISGGEIDMERAANMVLDELRAAKIGNITLENPGELELSE